MNKARFRGIDCDVSTYNAPRGALYVRNIKRRYKAIIIIKQSSEQTYFVHAVVNDLSKNIHITLSGL